MRNQFSHTLLIDVSIAWENDALFPLHSPSSQFSSSQIRLKQRLLWEDSERFKIVFAREKILMFWGIKNVQQ